MKFAANTNDSVKRRVLRVRLIHARNCIRKSGSAACGRKFCAPMRRILAHAEGCRQSGCAEDNCAETQRIIGHWQECAGDSCSICEPSKIEVKPSTEGNTFDEVVCILDESSPVDRPIERPPPKLEISEPDASDENAPAGQSTHGECDAGGATDSWNDFVQMISELSSKDNQIEKTNASELGDVDDLLTAIKHRVPRILLMSTELMFAQYLRSNAVCDGPTLQSLPTLIATLASTAIVQVANGTQVSIHQHFNVSKSFSTFEAIARMRLPMHGHNGEAGPSEQLAENDKETTKRPANAALKSGYEPESKRIKRDKLPPRMRKAKRNSMPSLGGSVAPMSPSFARARDRKRRSLGSPVHWKCSMCPQLFQTKPSLVAHTAVHDGTTKCHLCGAILSSNYSLKRHMTRHMTRHMKTTISCPPEQPVSDALAN